MKSLDTKKRLTARIPEILTWCGQTLWSDEVQKELERPYLNFFTVINWVETVAKWQCIEYITLYLVSAYGRVCVGFIYKWIFLMALYSCIELLRNLCEVNQASFGWRTLNKGSSTAQQQHSSSSSRAAAADRRAVGHSSLFSFISCNPSLEER